MFMPRTRSNGPSRPPGARGKDGRGSEGDEAQIRVRCPNPDCEIVYTVPAEYAGKRARCAECGTRTLIPTPTAVIRSRPADAVRPTKPTGRAREEAPPRPVLPEVRIGGIGRGHAGKTALFQAMDDSLVGDYLPSGLHLDAPDPREVARMIRESEESQRLLRQTGLPPTLHVSQSRYCVYEGERPRLLCRLREVI